MEVIGAVSSVVTLAETTTKLAKGLTHLAQRWHNAPEEIIALAHATQNLATKFAFVESTITNSPSTLIDDIPRQGLTELVLRAKIAINELDILYNKLDADHVIIQKARWAVKDARTVKSAMATIKDIEDGLFMWINFVSLKGHGLTLLQFEETQRIVSAGFAEMRRMFSGLTITQPSNLPLTATSRTGSSSIAASASTTTFDPTAPAASQTTIIRKFEALSWEASKTLQSWGIAGSVVKSTQGQSTDYDFGFHTHLPFAWLFGSYALRGQLSIRTSSLVSNTFTFRHPSYFTVARILHDSHPFFEACRSNDVAAVRTMLSTGEGRPTDIDSNGYSCLFYAIKTGSMDVVICLLDHGIAVDEAVVSQQVTPLSAAAYYGQIDMIRMLLRCGASLDRFDNNGNDASFYCLTLHRTGNRKVATVDMLKVIHEHTSLDTNRINPRMEAPFLHFIACYQDASEIDFLISIGCNVEIPDCHGYNALFSAARYGNPATYFALLKHGSDTTCLEIHLLRVIDSKAASFNSVTYDATKGPGLYDPILKDLLSRRPDLMTSICIIDGEVEDIQGPAIPLQQAVVTYGPKTEAWFLGVLRERGLETEQDGRRLQQLRLEGYGQHGMVLVNPHREPDDESSDEDSDGHGQSAPRAEEDGAEEVDEFFWDAEEVV